MNAHGVIQRQAFYVTILIGTISTLLTFIVPPSIEGYSNVFMSFWASVAAWGTASVIGVFYYLYKVVNLNKAVRVLGSGTSKALLMVAVGASALLHSLPSFAQTPIALEIPTDVIFAETNNWISTFAPVAAIGIGIAIALAILSYIGKMIIQGFRG